MRVAIYNYSTRRVTFDEGMPFCFKFMMLERCDRYLIRAGIGES